MLEKDQFERAYAEKHPEVAAREIGHYGEGKSEWAMSNDDLNRLVRETASRGSGMGAFDAFVKNMQSLKLTDFRYQFFCLQYSN